jgi:hypothetical protein
LGRRTAPAACPQSWQGSQSCHHWSSTPCRTSKRSPLRSERSLCYALRFVCGDGYAQHTRSVAAAVVVVLPLLLARRPSCSIVFAASEGFTSLIYAISAGLSCCEA